MVNYIAWNMIVNPFIHMNTVTYIYKFFFYKYLTYRFFRIASNKGKQLLDENYVRGFVSALPLH